LYKGYFCEVSTYQENRRRLNESRRASRGKQGNDFFQRAVDFVGEYIIGLPFKELRELNESPKSEVIPEVTPEVKSNSPSRSFDNTLEGQYQRYFQTPEMDYVFGAGARGEDAPKDASAMQELGNQLRAPETDTNIASMYASQSALGRVNQDAIQDYFATADLPGNVKLEKGTALQAWAKENPMLAQRLYQKNQQRIVDNPATDTGTAVRGETAGSFEQQKQYGAGSSISKSPTEFDISPAKNEDFEKEFLKLKLGSYFN
jgi:hypothetical protein|tara:strand:- start:9420 stop:10199 length:780 start_codon:yes stop_codon:yes gene_type:complete